MTRFFINSVLVLMSSSILIAMQEPPKASAQAQLLKLLLNKSKLPVKYATEGNEAMALESSMDIPGKLLNYKDGQKRTALHYAAEKGYLQLAQSLLNKGADHTLTDQNGDTPLMLAERNGHEETARLIREKAGI